MKLGSGYNAWIASNPYIVGSFACIGGGLFGLDISSMSGMLNNPYYLAKFGTILADGTPTISSGLQGGITCAMPAGSLGGSLIVSKLADIIGRKWVVIIAGLVWTLGAIIQGVANNVAALVAGRVVAGLAVGMASTVVPIYQSEIAAPAIRGRLVSLQQWSITWGILIQYFITFGFAELDGAISYKGPWLLSMIPGVILSIGMLFFPESPRYCMDKGRKDEALQILADLHGHGNLNDEGVLIEYHEMQEAAEFDLTQASRSYADLIKPENFRRVLLGCCLQMWSQLSGMNVLMYYVVYVFQSAGITGRRGALIASSVQYVVNVLGTVPAIIYIDKWGRRPMLIIGAGFMAFWLFIIGGLQAAYGHNASYPGSETTTWIISDHPGVTKGVIVCSYFFVLSFAMSWGPCSWTYASEIYSTRVRAKAVAFSTATNWAFNFALAYASPPALATLQYKTYFLYAGFNVAAFIQIFFMYPETKGRTLEEIEAVFAAGHPFSAWKIPKDIGIRTLAEIEMGNTVLSSTLSKKGDIDQPVHIEKDDSKVNGSF